MKRIFIIAGALLWSFAILAQDGFIDDFNTDPLSTDWFGNGQYALSQSDGELLVQSGKNVRWASFGVNIPQSDVSAKPVLNLTLKTETPVVVTAYLVSANGNVLINTPVMATSGYQVISYDFTGLDENSNVLNAVTTILIAFNGAATSWSGDVYFDEISLGSDAVKYAGVGGLRDMTFYQGTTGHRIFIRGIQNATDLGLSGADALLENVSFDDISADGTSWLNFDCQAAASGIATVTLEATADAGYTDYSTTFSLEVEANKPPVVDQAPSILASAGNPATVKLSGISDGNIAAVQPVLITATSDNLLAIENTIDVTYEAGSSYATLDFTPVGAGTASITVVVDDQQSADNTGQMSFEVEVLESWNNPPTLKAIPNTEFLNNAGEQTISLSGITDGDDGSQALTVTATSSETGIVPDPVVEYTGGSMGMLKITPVPGVSGIATITVTITDDGGAVGNNGNQSIERTFSIETYDPPMEGYVIPFDGATPDAFGAVQPGMRDYWHVEGLGGTQVVTHETDGTDDVFQVVCNNKSTWTGSWYYTPDMDLTDYPLISLWVKSDQDIQFHLYFWDDSIRNNEDHHLRYDVPANTWTKLEFDFSDPGGMLNNDGELVNAKRIQRVLFNYHPSFGWPFTNWSGTVSFRDIRIGNESGITPTYYCTVDPVGPQTSFRDDQPRTIELTGLSRTKDSVVTASVTGEGVVTGLSVSSVVDGKATITYTPSVVGTDLLTVTVSGDEIGGKLPIEAQIEIPVSVVDENAASSGSATVDFSETHQRYYGFGAKDPGASLQELYTIGGFGATAARFGALDNNQIELENDNADPNVLDMSKLNKDAFNWDYVKALKRNGVETFLFTYWSPPAWMKENLSTNYQQPNALTWEQTDNKVMPEMYDEYAEHIVATVRLFKQEADVDLAAIGIQNEPAFCEPYASAILSPVRFAEMVAKVGKRFEDEGIETRLYIAEQVGARMQDGPIYSNQAYLNALNDNPEAKKYSDIFAVHGYASDGIAPGENPGSAGWKATFDAINADGKTRELWMTETEPTFANWNDAFVNVANIVTSFESGNVGLWTEWAWDGHCIDQGQPTQKYWAQSMFKHIKPGARRVTSASGNNDILITTWKNDAEHGNNLVMVLLNKANSPLTITLEQENLPGTFELYRCSENVDAFRDTDYVKEEKLLIGARSIVTLVSGSYSVPGIDPVADAMLMIDDAEQVVNLTGITDGNEVNENPIDVTFSLSDNTIISGAEITYVSPDATGTFTYTPANAGSTDVTISVTANGITTTTQFTIEVLDYHVPQVDAIAGPFNYMTGSGTKTIDLTGINDGGDGGQTISVDAGIKSSDPAGVVGNLAVNYTSPDATGSVSFTPDAAGTATIEVTVTDDGPDGKNTTTTEFVVNVADHFPPTIDQVVDVTFEVGDEVTMVFSGVGPGDDSDVLTALEASSSDEGVTGPLVTSLGETSLTFTPAAVGSATITVTVTDDGPAGLNTTEMSFEVTVELKDGIPAAITDAIRLYPNPVGDRLNLEVTAGIFESYTIVTLTGTVLRNGEFIGSELHIETSALQSGSYLLLLEGRDGSVVKHFVK